MMVMAEMMMEEKLMPANHIPNLYLRRSER